MYSPDINEFHQFYNSALGKIAQLHISYNLVSLWPEIQHEYIVGLGYVTPYLPLFAYSSTLKNTMVENDFFSFMPVTQGAIYWPENKPNLSTLVDETRLPLKDNYIHRVLVTHMVEHTSQDQLMMKEIWRVLIPGGRVIMILPNRSGLWACIENNPFSQGKPYSQAQIYRLLGQSSFVPLHVKQALFFPPHCSPFLFKCSAIYERFARTYLPLFGGVWIVEAQKQLYGTITQKTNSRTLELALPVPSVA